MFPSSGQVFIKLLNKSSFLHRKFLLNIKAEMLSEINTKLIKLMKTKIVTQIKTAEFTYCGIWK